MISVQCDRRRVPLFTFGLGGKRNHRSFAANHGRRDILFNIPPRAKLNQVWWSQAFWQTRSAKMVNLVAAGRPQNLSFPTGRIHERSNPAPGEKERGRCSFRSYHRLRWSKLSSSCPLYIPCLPALPALSTPRLCCWRHRSMLDAAGFGFTALARVISHRTIGFYLEHTTIS